MISQPNSVVLSKLVRIFRDKMALVSSNLDPLDILGVLIQVEAGWELPTEGTATHKGTSTGKIAPMFRKFLLQCTMI